MLSICNIILFKTKLFNSKLFHYIRYFFYNRTLVLNDIKTFCLTSCLFNITKICYKCRFVFRNDNDTSRSCEIGHIASVIFTCNYNTVHIQL